MIDSASVGHLFTPGPQTTSVPLECLFLTEMKDVYKSFVCAAHLHVTLKFRGHEI